MGNAHPLLLSFNISSDGRQRDSGDGGMYGICEGSSTKRDRKRNECAVDGKLFMLTHQEFPHWLMG